MAQEEVGKGPQDKKRSISTAAQSRATMKNTTHRITTGSDAPRTLSPFEYFCTAPDPFLWTLLICEIGEVSEREREREREAEVVSPIHERTG